MRNKILLVAIHLLLVSGLLSLQAQKAVKLSFDPEDGSKYEIKISTLTDMIQSMMGQEIPMTVQYDITALYDVRQIESNKEIQITYDKVKMITDVMGRASILDSEDQDTTAVVSKMFQSLKGLQITALVNDKGEVLKVNGSDELTKRLGNGNTQIEETIKNMISDKTIKNQLEQAFKIFPDRKVKIGDTWATLMHIETPYKMTSDNIYSLKNIEATNVHLGITGTLSTNGEQTMDVMGQEIKVLLAGTQSGSIVMDLKSGMTMSSSLTQHLKGNFLMMGQEIPMTIKTTTRYDTTKIN